MDEVLLGHLVMHIEIVSSSSKGGHLAKTMTGAVAFSLPYIFFSVVKSRLPALYVFDLYFQNPEPDLTIHHSQFLKVLCCCIN